MAVLGAPTRNPKAILFCHQTISPCLTKDENGKQPGPNLNRLVAEIKDAHLAMTDLPPLSVFEITDPQTGDALTFSLSNRKLYIAKKSNADEVNTKWASFDEIAASTWKMTNKSGGYTYPNPTRYGNKEAQPHPDTLLARFKNDLDRTVGLFALNSTLPQDEQLLEIRHRFERSYNIRCK
jgi:hypothetical protein